MKKLLVTTTLAFMVLAKLLKPESENNRYYPETGVVVAINEDEVVVETNNGNLFAFYGAEDWFVGDVASLIMDGCGTENVEDDIVIMAKYSGTWELS